MQWTHLILEDINGPMLRLAADPLHESSNLKSQIQLRFAVRHPVPGSWARPDSSRGWIGGSLAFQAQVWLFARRAPLRPTVAECSPAILACDRDSSTRTSQPTAVVDGEERATPPSFLTFFSAYCFGRVVTTDGRPRRKGQHVARLFVLSCITRSCLFC